MKSISKNKILKAIFKEINSIESNKPYMFRISEFPVMDTIKIHLYNIMYDLELIENKKNKKRIKILSRSND